jgi:hypothetical protein
MYSARRSAYDDPTGLTTVETVAYVSKYRAKLSATSPGVATVDWQTVAS